MKKIKNPTTVEVQIELMRSRGMELNESLARQWLSSVSYLQAVRVLVRLPDSPRA